MNPTQLLSDTLAKPELFWAACGAIATSAAVWVAVRSPAKQAKRARELEQRKAETVLPTLLDELSDASERAEMAVRLIRSEMSGTLHPMGGVMQGTTWVRVISQQTKKRLVELALVDFPAYDAFGDRIGDLPFGQAEFLTQAYGQLLSARMRIRAVTEGWGDAAGLNPELMHRYSAEADTLLAASNRCVFYLSQILDRDVPDRLLPHAVAEQRRMLARSRTGRLLLWWRKKRGDI